MPPRLVSLDKHGNAPIWVRFLLDKAAWVLLEGAHLGVKLCVLAVVGVVRHISVLAVRVVSTAPSDELQALVCLLFLAILLDFRTFHRIVVLVGLQLWVVFARRPPLMRSLLVRRKLLCMDLLLQGRTIRVGRSLVLEE